MKILHIGAMVRDNIAGLSLSLMRRSDEYDQLGRNVSDELALSIYHRLKPDLIFLQLQLCEFLTVSALKQMSGAYIIHWSGDMRLPVPEFYKKYGDTVDITCFSNEQSVTEMTEAGFKSGFIQIGIDPLIFKKRPAGKITDIVFMANNYGPRFPLGVYREKLVEMLKGKYKSFKVFGSGWKWNDGSLNHSQIEESKYYNQSKIAISVSNYESERYFSDRLIRAMGSGCFTISHNYPGIERDFIIGSQLVAFTDFDDLCTQIDYYLNNESQREHIAQNGFDLIHNNFTFDKMADDILKIYELNVKS